MFKKNSSIATNFDEIKLIITNLTPMPLKKKPIEHVQKVEKNIDER
jgi:hypothetical protein